MDSQDARGLRQIATTVGQPNRAAPSLNSRSPISTLSRPPLAFARIDWSPVLQAAGRRHRRCLRGQPTKPHRTLDQTTAGLYHSTGGFRAGAEGPKMPECVDAEVLLHMNASEGGMSRLIISRVPELSQVLFAISVTCTLFRARSDPETSRWS